MGRNCYISPITALPGRNLQLRFVQMEIPSPEKGIAVMGRNWNKEKSDG